MVESQWEDTTSYERDADRGEPRVWKLQVGDVRLTVHRHIYYEPDQWLFSCPPFFDLHVLDHKDIKSAKFEAMMLVHTCLNAAVIELMAQTAAAAASVDPKVVAKLMAAEDECMDEVEAILDDAEKIDVSATTQRLWAEANRRDGIE